MIVLPTQQLLSIKKYYLIMLLHKFLQIKVQSLFYQFQIQKLQLSIQLELEKIKIKLISII